MPVRRHSSLRAACLASAAAVALTVAPALAQQDTKTFAIEAQDLATALSLYAAQADRDIFFAPEVAAGKRSHGVSGEVGDLAALDAVLASTGLTYAVTDSNAIMVTDPAMEREGPQSRTVLAQAETESSTGRTREKIIVTGQKREEYIQDVPIAISAFSMEDLNAQKIEGGFDLLKAIPNVTFSKNNFTSYNFSIRGVGTKAVSATTDPGVAVAFNNSAIIQNRLFEQEYYDIERVEVLRGPQGTLYGRNATSGVINVISAKPTLNEFYGQIKGEVGNFNTKRLSAHLNIPIKEDVLGVRLAGALTNRDGYDFNTVTDNSVNGRDLWSTRLTVGFEPDPRLRADFIWEKFEEDDDRLRTGKQLCHRDPNRDTIGTTPVHVTDPNNDFDMLWGTVRPAIFSTGCQAGSLYSDDAFGTPNGLAIPFIFGAAVLGNVTEFAVSYDVNGNPEGLIRMEDPYGGLMQSRDMREIASVRDPSYRAKADLFELNVDFDLTPELTISSQTAYVDDEVYSFQDFNRFNTQPVFRDTSTFGLGTRDADWSGLAPGGVFCDPQIGCSETIAGFDISQATAEQFSQEFRLQSAFSGPFNFSVGANYTTFDVLVDYYIMFNLVTAVAMTAPFNTPPLGGEVDIGTCGYLNDASVFFFGNLPSTTLPNGTPGTSCPYIDPNPVESIGGDGHNYFRSKNPYELESWAGFGEAYWNLTDNLKLTAGLRYTDDQKTFIPVPSQILLSTSLIAGGTTNRGYPEGDPIVQEWGEWTGRLGVDWKPDLGATDETLLYAFYSRGYKGGGANPPKPGFQTEEEYLATASADSLFIRNLFNLPLPVLELTADEYGDTFDAEFVNAYEVGMKNTLLGGGLTFNATAFYYDYEDYQVSQIRDRTAVNENFDAEVWGLEFETLFAPSEDFQMVANIGYLDTKIADGEQSIDIINRTQGDPDYTVAKPWLQLPSNCVVPTHVVEEWLTVHPGIWYWQLCGGVGGFLGFLGELTDPVTSQVYDPLYYNGVNPGTENINGGAGLYADLGGNELPNAPHWTANLGAQYGMDILDGSWRATIRGDAYWQSQSYHRIYNYEPYDKLRGWYNLNLALKLERPDDGLAIELYAKNVLDDTPITDAFLNSDDTGLTTNVFTLDPRLIGLSLTKEF